MVRCPSARELPLHHDPRVQGVNLLKRFLIMITVCFYDYCVFDSGPYGHGRSKLLVSVLYALCGI
jgi:hypothetical protein